MPGRATKPEINADLQIDRQGKTFTLYDGLLDAAWPKLEGIETEELLVEYDQGKAVRARHKATVTYDGRKFTGHGDADVHNTSRTIQPHLIRMSETRAKARALRDAINAKGAAFEELSGGEEETDRPQEAASGSRSGGGRSSGGRSQGGGSRGGSGQSRGRQQNSREEEPPPQEEEHPSDAANEDGPGEDPGELANEQQIKALEKLCDDLKREGQTKDDAVKAFEDSIGFPLALLSETRAGEEIARLNAFKSQRRGRG